MLKTLFSFALCSMLASSAWALQLPEIFSDNMMLQQQTKAKMWGWAKAGNVVEVTTTWSDLKHSATAGADGRWMVEISTPSASYDTYSMTVKGDGETVVINNVLVGEVWFCSGQSNMEMPLGGFWNCPVEGANEAIAQSAKYRKSIRVATIPKVAAQTPQDRVAGKWQECNPENASAFSACGFFFARTLTDLLDVPVGIINCSWGGSCVEGWLPKEILETYPDGVVPFNDADYMAKMVMYNGMLHPLAGYTIKGFLWNQGESNIGREHQYAERFMTMVKHWRKLWNQPNDKLPIYTVELPPYWYDDNDGDNGAKIREVQHQIAASLENSGCVCTSDLVYDYESKQIHGTKKLEIGQRLAYMAAVRDYGMKGLMAEAPEFDFMTVVDADDSDAQIIAGSAVAKNKNEKGKVVLLYFKNCSDGFDRLDNIEGFEAAGADGVYHKAIVWAASEWRPELLAGRPQGCFLKLVCPEAAEVKDVRYCFKNFIPGKLHGMRGLPVVPFRTDKK
ncbi:MAG: sialate O-acetylesterase [Bacteroidaceae bacterium]|nr:sialate O-acetylesterase [Bacteroidaceae bacterium]